MLNIQDPKMLGTIECESGGQKWRFELQQQLSSFPGGAHFQAKDVSSPHLALDGPDSGLVHVEVRQIDQHQTRKDYLTSLEKFRRVGCDSFLWRMYASGEIQRGRFAGCVLVAGECWSRLASATPPAIRWDANDCAALYDQLTRALFWMHEFGLAHGNVSAETVACVGDESARNWKLLPAGPRPQQPVSMTDDMLALGKLMGRTLGINTSVSLRELKIPASLSSDWRTILIGCMHPNPDQRWTSGRALFGAHSLPIAAPLTVIPGVGRYRVEWPDSRYDVALFELASLSQAVEPGTVRSTDVLNGFGRQVSAEGREANVLSPVEGRVFQAVTRLDEEGVVVFGGVVRLSSQADVTKLVVRINRGRLTATFDWPVGATLVRLALRGDRYASSPNDAERIIDFTYREYHHLKAEVDEALDEKPSEWLFVTAFAERSTPTGEDHAPGASDGCRWTGPGFRHRVTYRIERTPAGSARSESSNYELVLVSPTPVRLPQLVLRADPQSSSLRSDRGTSVLNVRAGTVLKVQSELRIRFSFATGDGRRGWVVKLFPVDDTENQRVDLLSKNPDGERLE